MSGICGYLNSPRIISGQVLNAMAEQLVNDPKDTVTVSSFFQSALASTQSGSADFDGDLLGAIQGYPRWSHKKLAEIAKAKTHAAAVVGAFRRFGPDFLEHLHGAFAVAVLAPKRNLALLAVDRLGVRPLAFYLNHDTLIFGSRVDAVCAHPQAPREIDQQVLFDYVYFHMIPSPESIYLGIEKILPGQVISFHEGRVSRAFYWQAPYSESSKQSESELKEEMFSRLRKAVSHNINTDSIGAFLSGGLDSSTVAALLAENTKGRADAFGIGFSAQGYDEMAYARVTAKRFNVNLHEYYVTPEDLTATVPLVAKAYDEPFGNASALPAYYCAKLAKESGKDVLLAGDGGDEIFAGNARYAKQKIFDLYRHVPRWVKGGLLEPLLLGQSALGRIPPLRKVKSYIQQARLPMPDRLESYNFLHRESLDDIFSAGFLASVDCQSPLKNLREVYERTTVDSMLKRMLHLDLKITLADNDLRKVNRMCELAGIEVRYPMLDEKLVEFSARVPSRLLLKRLELRSFYRKAMEGFLAPETLNKNKQGFGLPFGVWMVEHRPLQTLAYESLDNFKTRGYLNSSYLDQLIEQHRTGHAGYYGVMIWVLMMLEQWLQAHGH